MPIVFGVGASYSPLLYRPRSQWSAIARHLVGNVTQPKSREREDPALLANYERRIGAAFDTAANALDEARLDALVVLIADRGDMFDGSNVPQLHVQVGGEVWGDATIRCLGEPSRILRFACDGAVADLLAEELVRVGFDLSEGRGDFKPLGETGQGIGAAATAAVERLGRGLPLVPIQVNCHVEPTLTGARLDAFGVALAEAADFAAQRIGILVSGGLSGDPGGAMAGWIDDVLDEWVLSRLTRNRSTDIAQIWGARTRTLAGSSAEIRLWTVAASALGQAGCRARIIDYLPIHHAATGVGFVAWEPTPCR